MSNSSSISSFQLYKTVILDPPDLQKLYWLQQDLEIQLKQLELLIKELGQITQHPGMPLW